MKADRHPIRSLAAGLGALALVAAGTARADEAAVTAREVAEALNLNASQIAALERGRTGERYILGGENLSGLELIQRIASIVGGRAPRRAAPRPLVAAGARILSLKEHLLGSKPPVTSEILRLAGRFMYYSSAKADRELDWRAGPVDPGIRSAWAQLQAAD